jgi:hypothetical protein
MSTLTIFAIATSLATAQGSGGSFQSYYGTDGANATRAAAKPTYTHSRSQSEPGYQSHFGTTKPAGHIATPAAPANYEYGMDADSLYAAGAAQGYYQMAAAQQYAAQLASAQAYSPYIYYYAVPATGGISNAENNSTPNDGISTVSMLAPGVDWQVDYANFQDGAEEVPPLPPAAGGAANGAGEGSGDTPTFGQQQEEQVQESVNNQLEFLRSQSVLLDKGERQIDIGFSYNIADGLVLQPQQIDQAPDPDALVISTIKARQRLFVIPIEFRYGLTDNIQVFCNIPFGWANAELAVPGLVDEWSNSAGIGDVTCGASVLLCQGCNGGPDVVSTFAFTAPTADADFFITGGAPNSRLGEGFWGTTAQLLFIHTLDPCVVFYSAGYNHRFDGSFNLGIEANPGEQFFYQMGVGFAASEKVTLTTSFLGAYVTEDHVLNRNNNLGWRRVQGGINEPMRLRFSATIARPCKIVEPFAEIGMTRDSAAGRFGITWTY